MVSLLLLVGTCLAYAPAASAQSAGQPAASGWFDGYRKSGSTRSLDLSAAGMQQTERAGGYGPGSSETNVYGDVNSWNTYEGPVQSATSYNSVNSASTSTWVGPCSSGVNISVSTGQSAGDTQQSANSGVHTGAVTTTKDCSEGSCNQ